MEVNSHKRQIIESHDNQVSMNKRKKKGSAGADFERNRKENEIQQLEYQYKQNLDNLKFFLENEVVKEIKTISSSFEKLNVEYKKLIAFPVVFQKLNTKPLQWHKQYKKKLEDFQNKIEHIKNEFQNEIYNKTCNDLVNTNHEMITKRLLTKSERLKKNSDQLIVSIKKTKTKIEKFKEEITKRINKLDIGISIKRQTTKGDDYQRILQVLIRQRGLMKHPDPGLEVGVEVSGVGRVDDVVLAKTNDKKCRFFQMKYVKNKEKRWLDTKILFKIPENEEIIVDLPENVEQQKTTKQKLDLHLLYYFKSFCEIKENEQFENYEVEEITFVTNRDINLKPGEKNNSLLKKADLKNDEILFFESGIEAKKYGLNVDKVYESFGEALLNLSKLYLQSKKENAEEIIKEFFKKVYIVVNYPDLEKLKELTFNEVFHENVFANLNKEILGMWILYIEIKLLQIDKEFLTTKVWVAEIDKLKMFIHGVGATEISRSKIRRIPSDVSDDIFFEVEAMENMKEDLVKLMTKDNKYSVLSFIDQKQNTKLTFVKVIHIIQLLKKEENLLFCDFEDLVLGECFFEALTYDKFSLLIVMCKQRTSLKLTEEMSIKLRNALANSKKIILISEDSNSLSERLKELTNEKYLERSYQHEFKDLSQCSKNKILGTKIIFQQKLIDFGMLINEDLAKNAIDGNCIWEIVERKKTNLVLCSNNDSFSSPGFEKIFYIGRKFHQTTIEYETLKQFSAENLVFITGAHGMTKTYLLKVLAEKGLKKQVSKWTCDTDPKSGIVLEGPSDLTNNEIFDSILKKSPNACWLIMNENNKLQVIGLEKITKKLQPLEKSNFIEEILDTTDLGQTVILVGGSGVGKSTTLTSIANKIRDTHPNTWVAKVNLRKTFLYNTLENLKNSKYKSNPEVVINSVIKLVNLDSIHNSLEKNLLKEGLKKKYEGVFRFVLLLDGYNEIDETSQNNVISLIQTVRNCCNIEQIWVTTQNQEKFALESSLQVAAYVLDPLESSDQINLMVKYWKFKYSQQVPPIEYSDEVLIQDAKTTIVDWKKSISDEEKKQFTENSLNLIMLADVLLSTERKIKENMNLLDLYDTFVQKKFLVYRKESSLSISNYEDTKCIETAKDKLFENFVHEILQQLSVRYILNKYKNNDRKDNLDKLSGMNTFKKFKYYIGENESKHTLTKLGLLTFNNDNELDFIHFSFAQFFFSEYLIQNRYSLNSELKTFFVQFVWCASSLQPCRKFLNRALMKLENMNDERNKEDVKNSKSRNKLTKGAVKILLQKTRYSSIPIWENHYYLLKFLLSWLDESDYKKYLDKVLKLDLANYSSNKEVIEKIVQYLHNSPKVQSTNAVIKLVGCKFDHSTVYNEVLTDLALYDELSSPSPSSPSLQLTQIKNSVTHHTQLNTRSTQFIS